MGESDGALVTDRADIVLDLSRLLSRVLHATPTGVDRVEMAYARGLMARAPERLSFAAVHPAGPYGRLPGDAVRRFLDETEQRWELGAVGWNKRRFATRVLGALWPRPTPRNNGRRRIYVQASPHHLTERSLVEMILRREQARFLCLVHDLIPLQYPEYARPEGAIEHRRRIETVAGLAGGIIANSHATLRALEPWLAEAGTEALVKVAHLGTHDHGPATAPPIGTAEGEERPYFVCIGTIEPRKNHLLLLNIWRRMAEQQGADAIPRLILVGRRGWENEQVVDMLERCPALTGCVEELGTLSDRETRELLASARALLLPSFAEGYGMPVTEALDLGVPVIASALPALREAGGIVPEFLDPLDGPGWERAIIAYAGDGRDRQEQLARLEHWQRPSWDEHIESVLDMVSALA